jgi:hypothetical protein
VPPAASPALPRVAAVAEDYPVFTPVSRLRRIDDNPPSWRGSSLASPSVVRFASSVCHA